MATKAPETAEKTETKGEAFVRVASNRTNKAVEAIEKISNTFSPNYDYTPEQGAKIVAALRAAVDKVENASKGIKASTGGFSL